ncbi:MFS transporter [Streptomyces sp. 891-h]|uniref:MFS transporter n=1 Tax=Streptomyces sp. 891-h TaxID=2720714 RepID=UPI001FAA95EA|nr:MFS transporter [Streptomyces sp. 891-h]UNZ16836.1 MFS transporter [Streptomyces sp. 891-h]
MRKPNARTGPPGGALRALTLLAGATGAAVVALDGTVLVVVQPAMRHELGGTLAQLQWAGTGYLIAVASLLVFAGRLGDRYGHHRLFALGMLGFGAASAGIGVADGIGWVIGLRAVQGVFGALLQPATLGMLRAVFPPERLGMAIAVRTSVIGLAAAVGPVLGGALAAGPGWRAVFFLNVPVAVAVGIPALLAARRAPGRTARDAGLDLPGACLLGVALLCLVHTLVAVPDGGWTTVNGLAAAVGAVTAAVFVRHERRYAAAPLVPGGLLRTPGITPALALLLVSSAALHGTLFVGTYFLQDVVGLDPFECAVRTLPLAVTMVLGAPLCAVLLRRYGPRRTAGAGAVVLAAGVALLSRAGAEAGAGTVGAAFFALGGGFVAVMVTATSVVVRQAPAGQAGVAGGLKQTAVNVGPVLGVAAATTLMSVRSATGQPPDTAFLAAMAPTLGCLALVAAIGLLPAGRLPGSDSGSGTKSYRRVDSVSRRAHS